MKGNKGQVVVEYMLMLVVVVSIVTSIMALIKKKYIGDPTKCKEQANINKLSCKIDASFNPIGSTQKKFQYYPFKK